VWLSNGVPARLRAHWNYDNHVSCKKRHELCFMIHVKCCTLDASRESANGGLAVQCGCPMCSCRAAWMPVQCGCGGLAVHGRCGDVCGGVAVHCCCAVCHCRVAGRRSDVADALLCTVLVDACLFSCLTVWVCSVLVRAQTSCKMRPELC
jgi:hypothetical protein